MSAIFLTSFNNSSMLQEFMQNNRSLNPELVLNIDLGSDDEHLLATRALEKKWGFQTISIDNRSMSNCLVEAAKWALGKQQEWITYCHHDLYELTPQFFPLMRQRLQSIPEFVGSVGVNIYHDELEISQWDSNSPSIMTVARCFLQKGDGWYRPRETSRFERRLLSFGESFFAELFYGALLHIAVNKFSNI